MRAAGQAIVEGGGSPTGGGQRSPPSGGEPQLLFFAAAFGCAKKEAAPGLTEGWWPFASLRLLKYCTPSVPSTYWQRLAVCHAACRIGLPS